MRYIIWPHKMASRGARELATVLGCRRVRSNGMYIPQQDHEIINWGNCNLPNWLLSYGGGWRILNHVEAVSDASNKITALGVLTDANVPTVPWTTDPNIAMSWLNNGPVFARTMLRASQGRGIVVCNRSSGLTNAPLYTKYLNARYEYRVHVFKDQVIHIQQKRGISGYDGPRVRGIKNLANGYIFSINDVVTPDPSVLDASIRAIAALGLDFGAVDVLQYKGRGYVLEVNTAPGLEGTTITRYGNAFRDHLNNLDEGQVIK